MVDKNLSFKEFINWYVPLQPATLVIRDGSFLINDFEAWVDYLVCLNPELTEDDLVSHVNSLHTIQANRNLVKTLIQQFRNELDITM